MNETMANSVGARHYDRPASAVSLSRIYFILLDPDCVKMLQMISEDRQPKVSDIGSQANVPTTIE